MTLAENDRLIGDRHGASRADWNARAVGGHVIGHDRVDVLAILAPPGLRHAAVERLARRNTLRGRGSIGGDDGEMLHAIGAILLLVTFEKRELLPVGTPLGAAAAAAARDRRQRFLRG